MYFDRKVKYLDYMENGERIKGAGFVKIEVRDQVCRMRICVRGLHVTDHYEKQVILVADKQESILCKIKIEGGEGSTGELCLDSEHMGRGELRYAQLEEIRIPIAAGKEIRCIWREKNVQKEKKEMLPREEAVHDLQRLPESGIADNREDTADDREDTVDNRQDTVEDKGGRQDNESEERVGDRSEKENKREESGDAVTGVDQETASADIVIQEQQFPLDDKWSQLVSIYPHIAPFEDEREYLSLGPGDFVIFPSRYYRLVNNSFLLHGYHNYQHLILSRMEVRGEIRYYVGVPGNFYDKEKQVAMMFGFESFECEEEPARSGDYGYYMMRVEL